MSAGSAHPPQQCRGSAALSPTESKLASTPFLRFPLEKQKKGVLRQVQKMGSVLARIPCIVLLVLGLIFSVTVPNVSTSSSSSYVKDQLLRLKVNRIQRP